MTADRPGFRNSTHLVGPGVVQLENGLSLSADHTLAMEPEIRIGTLSWLELRLVADDVVLRSSPGTGIAGTSDLQPGIKFPVFNRCERYARCSNPEIHGAKRSLIADDRWL